MSLITIGHVHTYMWKCKNNDFVLYYRTPLHLACVKGNKPIVQELLEWHAKPNIGDNEGKTPLLKVRV